MANSSKRPSFNLVVFEEKYGRGEDEMTALNSRAFRKRGCIESVRKRLAKKRLKPGEFIMNRIPFINLIRTYKLSYLLKDIIAGLTVGVIQIAPTMANATTAELPPINGLYVAFFSVIAYLIFGTSKHLSIGTHGVISIMVGNALKNFEGILYPDDDELDNGLVANQTDPNYISNNPEEAKILISMMLSFQAGAIQIILGLINGGFISKYLSDTLVEAFTIGSSYLIVVSQIGTILGITVHRMKLPFKMIDTLIGAFRQIKNIQPMSISLSLGAMLIIFLVRKYVNERYRKKLPAPIPIELIVVIVATALSFWLNLGGKYNLHLVGHVPLGIPQPKLPPFRIFSMLFVEGFSIALVSFALNVSMGKLFAKKYNYHINVNQELFAYGVGNMMSSLFNGMPAAGGLTRTLIVETTGAKTQMFSIVSSAFVLIVIVGLGFLFRYLPYCCLASIIVISLSHKCLEVTRIARLLRKSLSESIIWLSTFLGVVILDIDYGLYIGLAVSIISVVVKSQLARVSILGRIDETNIYEPINNYPKAREHDMIKIIRFEDSIYYANVENFSNSVLNTLEINYEQVLEQLNDLKKTVDKQEITTDANNLEKGVAQKNELEVERAKILNQIAIHHVILDCSCVNFIDLMGVNGLIQMCEYLKKFDIKLHLTCMKPSIIKTLKRMDDGNKLDMTKIYPTIEDAVQTILADEPEKQHHEAPIYE